MTTTASCDFCGKEWPEWIYPAKSFKMGYDLGSRGGWAACETCSTLVEAGDDRGLMERALERSPALASLSRMMGGLTKDERQLIEGEVVHMHNKFRRSRKGPRRPFG